MAATWVDRAVTAVAAPELSSVADAQDENDRMLKARWERILARNDLTPLQRLNAEREYARLGGSINNWDDIAEGNSETFATEYVETARKVTTTAVGIVTDAIPVKLWLFAAFAVVVLFFFKFGNK